MNWMVYSWVTSFSTTLVVVLVCLYLFRQYREPYLGIWTAAWAAYSFRFIFELLMMPGYSGAMLFFFEATLLASGLFIAWGTYAFVARPLPAVWLWTAGAAELWSAVAIVSGTSFSWTVAPVFVFQAVASTLAGVIFLRAENIDGFGKYLAGWAFILAGLHGIDYPLFAHNEQIAPWGFLVSNLFTFCIAIGFLLVFFQRVREALRESEDRHRVIFENSAFGVFESTPEGKIIHVNPAFTRMFGYNSPGEALHSEPGMSLHVTPERSKEILQEMTGHAAMRLFENLYQRKDGNQFVGLLRIQSIPDGKNGFLYSGFIEDITEKKHTEEKLRKVERRFREMLDTVRLLAMTLDANGRVTYCNPHLLDATGYSEEELIGGDWFRMFAPPETRAARRDAFIRMVRDGHVPTYHESEIVTRSGERRIVAWNNTVFRDAQNRITDTAYLGEDITERKRMEHDLRESEERYRTLFETMIPGVILQDAHGKVISANPAAERILGMTVAEMRDCASFAVFRGAIHEDGTEFPPETQPPLVALRTGDAVSDSAMGVSIPGEEAIRWIIMSAVPKPENGDIPARIFTTFQDVTEQKSLIAQLIQAQKLETVGRLAGGIAHDFNNLLTIISGNAEIASMLLPADHPARETILDITVASERAAVLTRRLLAFSRRTDAEPSLVSFNTLLLDMNRVLRRLIHENIEIVSLPGENLWTVRIDPVQFEQILVNLIVNSRDAMPEGGKITVKTENAVLDEAFVLENPGSTTGEFVLISVRDTGTGMGAKTLARIFEPFFTTKDTYGGSGLGLATCQSIVKQYGGYIRAESEPGVGTVMSVYVPRVLESAASPVPADRRTEYLNGTETVLLVEDEPDVRRIALHALASRGYRVIEADHGEEAIRLVERMSPDTVHVLLTDVVMPRMGGKELAQRLRKRQPDIKVMFMSGYIPDQTDQKGILEEGDGFIQKPFSPAVLLQNLRRFLDRKEADER